MGEDRISESGRKRFSVYAALIFIVVIGALVRLLFFTGMVRGDALNYANAAYYLSQGVTDLGDWAGVPRVGMYVPVALLYKLFGANQTTTLAFPFLSSLSTIVFLFLIGRLVANEKAGLIAALIWAFFPLDILLATALLPDGPVAALLAGALYFLLKGVNETRIWNRKTGIGFLLVVAAIAVKPIALMGLFAAIGLLIWVSRGRILSAFREQTSRLSAQAQRGVWAVCAVVFVGGILLYSSLQPFPMISTLAKTSSDLFDFFFNGSVELHVSDLRLESSSLIIFIAPLFLLAFVRGLLAGNEKTHQLILWLSICFLYYEWGSIKLNPLIYVPLGPYNDARYQLFLLPPIIVLVGVYLSEFFWGDRYQGIIWVAGSVTLGIALFLTGRETNTNIQSALQGASLLIVTITILSISLITKQGGSRKKLFGTLNLILLLISLLRVAVPYHASWYAKKHEDLELLTDAADLLRSEPHYHILVPSKGNAIALNYVSDFTLGYDWTDTGQVAAFRIRDTNPPTDESYYEIVFGEQRPAKAESLLGKFEGGLGGVLTIWEVAPSP